MNELIKQENQSIDLLCSDESTIEWLYFVW